ncbi:hypothetical protein COT51_03855 [candidate division WWE3 bacterium CG08_land_8_20_14_0_20_41_15]|uniref:Uncharacterized protein n=1 Tax=candidate division WWE3 bacterium CG08_land_8_20_14_0_20_41_15 TaxID=1975086 RepID=A0A2H0XAW6_UNCKA|nr:MAG: hypothetical protein COT51_03855 [candidate division WWE3 bacterium CG08_land_8_20_14_0_20_41_15]
MDFSFKINENLLLVNTLVKAKGNNLPFSAWVNLQNTLWEKHKRGYSLLKNGFENEIAFDTLQESVDDISALIDEGKKSKEFGRVLNEVEDYKKELESKWQKDGQKASAFLEEILKIKLPDKEFTVLITHPKVGNGKYAGENTIIWGHEENWPNYSIVYLFHEALHEILGKGKFVHEIIELASDNELRIRLNGKGEYFTENGQQVGHLDLIESEKKLLPNWQKYLKDPNMTIFEFLKSLE